ncbi:MAG: stage III sporulation protein AF [Betaproteobacteria bacterium]
MIDATSSWVRDLAVMALVLAFAEMLLPRNDLRKFARVVIGLVLVAVVLGSLVDLSSVEDTLSTPSTLGLPGARGGGEHDYAAEGNRIAQAGLEVASRAVQARLERQVESLARLASGSEATDAQVELGPSGDVSGISVVVRVAPAPLQARAPEDGGAAAGVVAAGGYTSSGQGSMTGTAAVAARVEQALRDFYGLNEDVPVIVEVRG